MVKRFTYTFILMLGMLCVLTSQIVPHHHHHGETIICLADDLNALEDPPCEHHHPDGENCGCTFRHNLALSHVDSREEESCSCDVAHVHPLGHLFSILLAQEPYLIPSKEPHYHPYRNLYLSVLIEGHQDLRAPPVA